MGHEQIMVKKGSNAYQRSHSQPGPIPLNTNTHQSSLVQHYRNIGNDATQRMVESGAIQAKLKIGQPNDKYEQEADRVADQVMRMPEPKGSLVNGHSSLVQRKSTCPECMEEEEELIQTKPLAEQITPLVQRQIEPEEEEESVQAKQANNQTPSVTSTIESGINSIRGGGQPLPESARSYFEPRFSTDFSQVRVHTDSKAAEKAKSINAKAFTKGKDVVFGDSQYSPGTSTGKRLLAHELTHVVQQNYGKYGKIRMIQKAEVDDNPTFCFPEGGESALQDVSSNINNWITEARPTSESNAIHIVNAVYQDLGSGGVRAVVEERIAALPETHVRHVEPSESRYSGQQWFPSIAAQLRTRRLSPVVNLCGVCVGVDKIGHFFDQGYEYFRLGQQLRQRIRSWSVEERERFQQNISPPLPPTLIEIPIEIPEEMHEDMIVGIYTNEFGKWLEGFEHRLPPEEVEWIRGLDFIPFWYSEGVYGASFSGVLSRADLAANNGGGWFYIDLWRNPSQDMNICDYVSENWNERQNLSTFERIPTPFPTGPRSRSTIAEEP